MRLKELQIKEAATAGATASGNIAAVVNPHVANPSRNSVAYTGTPGVSGKGPVKQVKGGTYNTGKNALDGDKMLMSSKEPQMIRRHIKEGSLYEEQLNEWLPALAIGAGVVAAGGWVLNKFGKWIKKERGKTQAALDDSIAKATDGYYAKPKVKADEGHITLPSIDTERYAERPGLEGPIRARNGRVVYYDPKEGQYYDPDTDIYISNDDWKAMNEGLKIEPRGEAGKANAFKGMMANASKNKEPRAINTEKPKRQTAQAAGYRAIVGGKDVSQIAKG